MHDTRVLFICVTAVSTVCVHVRHPAIPSQRARASSVGKTPSFSFCQVDMYGLFNSTGFFYTVRLSPRARKVKDPVGFATVVITYNKCYMYT